MFAIAFDLVVADTQKHHPSKSPPQAYADIRNTLGAHGFNWVQGSLYTNAAEDLAQLFAAIMALKALPWFPLSVRGAKDPEPAELSYHQPCRRRIPFPDRARSSAGRRTRACVTRRTSQA